MRRKIFATVLSVAMALCVTVDVLAATETARGFITGDNVKTIVTMTVDWQPAILSKDTGVIVHQVRTLDGYDPVADLRASITAYKNNNLLGGNNVMDTSIDKIFTEIRYNADTFEGFGTVYVDGKPKYSHPYKLVVED